MNDEPGNFDDAAHAVHRAFCDPEHELVGEWDRAMAAALRRNGYALIELSRVAHALHTMKGGGPFGREGECECRDDATALLRELTGEPHE